MSLETTFLTHLFQITHVFKNRNIIGYYCSFPVYCKGERRVASVSQTPASVHGVSQPRPASILLPTSQNTPLESAGTGMTGENIF